MSYIKSTGSKKKSNEAKDDLAEKEKKWNEIMERRRLQELERKKKLRKKMYLGDSFSKRRIQSSKNRETKFKGPISIKNENFYYPSITEFNRDNENNDNYKDNDENFYDEKDNNKDENKDFNYQIDEFSTVKNMSHDEIDTYINLLWDDLGVLKDYKKAFNKISKSLKNDPDARNEFYSLEIENLKKLETYLINIKKQIEKREKIILLFKKLTDIIKTRFIDLNKEVSDNIINDFTKAVQNIRVCSVHIVVLMNKIREICTYGTNKGKFNLNNTKYSFDENYLIKMKNDLDFLGNIPIYHFKEKRFKCCSNGDPFLININNAFPIKYKNFKLMRQSQYLIMQDIIYQQVSLNSEDKNKNMDYNKSIIKSKIIIDSNPSDKKNKNDNTIKNSEQNKQRENKKEKNEKKEKEKKIDDDDDNIEELNDIVKVEEIYVNSGIKNQGPIEEEKSEKIEELTSSINVKEIKNKKEENTEDNIEENIEENIKEKRNELQSDVDEDGGNELRNSILNSSRLGRYNRLVSKNSLRRSITPETYKKTISDKLHFSFYKGDIKVFDSIFQTYYNEIPENQKIIFNINPNILDTIYNYFTPKIIICSEKKNLNLIKGICIIGFFFDNKNNIQVYLIHLSSNSEDERDNIISYFISFIRENVECDEIIVDLYYKYDETLKKFMIDSEIRDIFKNNLKFKWVKLENLSNHSRYQKMSLKIDKTDILGSSIHNFITFKKLIPDKLFSISDNCNLKIKQISDDKDNNNEDINDKYINLFSVLALFDQMKNIKSYEFSSYSSKYKTIFENTKKIEEMGITDIINFMDNDDNNFSLNINCSPIFNSTICTEFNNYYYNRIESSDIQILIDQNTKTKFYLIPTQNGHNSIIISEINDEMNQKIFNNKSNIYDLFKDFYENLINENNDDNSKKVIYIPSFILETNYNSKNISCLNNVNISKNKKKYRLDNIEENIKVEYKIEENNSSFKISKEETDIIIKEDFLMSIVNYDILSNLSFPSFLLFKINKENWIKKSE